MMEYKSKSGALRRKASSFRCYPYATRSGSGKKAMKEEVVRLGTELSLCVAESMFLLCDDIFTLLSFCFKLWKSSSCLHYPNRVLERLFRVILHVYSNDIKPKNGVYENVGKSVQWDFVKTAWEDLYCGIVVLSRIVLALGRKDRYFDDKLLLSAIEQHKKLVKNLEETLRCAKDVSEANGFVRESIKCNIFYIWKSLFDEEAEEETPQVLKNRILSDLFKPHFDKPWDIEIMAMPKYDHYILGRDFAKNEMKKEAMLIGIELSLYVAQLMFLLSYDTPRMLWFCANIWIDVRDRLNPNSVVGGRLLGVMHYVYLRYIRPNNGEGISLNFRLDCMTLVDLSCNITNLENLVFNLNGEGRFCFLAARVYKTDIEQSLKKLEEKFMSRKADSEAIGFERNAIACSIAGLWKSLFDKEVKEATQTLKVIKHMILHDLFHPFNV